MSHVCELKIEIKSIKITKRYFEFYFMVFKDGTHKLSGTYSDSHCRNDDEGEFIYELENGYAYELVMESNCGNIFG